MLKLIFKICVLCVSIFGVLAIAHSMRDASEASVSAKFYTAAMLLGSNNAFAYRCAEEFNSLSEGAIAPAFIVKILSIHEKSIKNFNSATENTLYLAAKELYGNYPGGVVLDLLDETPLKETKSPHPMNDVGKICPELTMYVLSNI